MKKSIALVLAIIALLSLTIPVSANTDSIGDDMAHLGFAFLYGDGVDPDYEKALNYFIDADRYGSTDVQLSLGEMYEKGFGVETDLVRAVVWYLKAAEMGNTEAQERLETEPLKSIARAMNAQNQESTQNYSTNDAGSDHSPAYPQHQEVADKPVVVTASSLFETGAEQPSRESLEYYLTAAEQGDTTVFFNLGEMYESGTGTEKNLVEAVKWYLKAAEAGSEEAKKKLQTEPLRSIAEAMSVQEQATYANTATGDMENIPRKGPVYPQHLVNNPVVDAESITIVMIIDWESGLLPDEWYFYYKDASGHWQHGSAIIKLTEEQKKGQPVVCHIMLDGKQTFTSFALNPVYPGMDFNASIETYLVVSESNLGVYGSTIQKPSFKLATGKSAMSISRRPEVSGSPTNIMGYISGGGVCFIAGTTVHTENGLVPIEEIRKGDLVWSWNEQTQDIELKPVVETYVNPCIELVHLYVNSENITCTPQHRFYVQQKGWIRANELHAGDTLVLLDGKTANLEGIWREKTEETITVYNFQVKDTHSYFVGELGVMVHNAESAELC